MLFCVSHVLFLLNLKAQLDNLDPWEFLALKADLVRKDRRVTMGPVVVQVRCHSNL